MRTYRLFELDTAARWRLSYDSAQWILEKRSGGTKPGKDSGYRGERFIAGRKATLLRDCREKKVELTPEAIALLNAMPERFLTFRDEIQALGRDEWLATLHRDAGIGDRVTGTVFSAPEAIVVDDSVAVPTADNDDEEIALALVTGVDLATPVVHSSEGKVAA